MGSTVLEASRQEKLLRVMEERGFTLSQQNGQRIYGSPPPNWGSRLPPSRESEIFIGRIPRLCFEDELIPLFSSIGELYEFRLMLDFSGTNRGFAYAQYAEEESAFRAIKLLNHYEIRPGHHIGVLRCKNNCRLLFSNIKQCVDLNIFSEQVRSLTKEILNITMYENFEELKATEIGVTLEIDEAFRDRIARYAPESKLAIVEYETHKAAAVARRILIPKLGHTFGIDWAIPPKDGHHFDQGLSSRFDANFAAGTDFLKIRPVPLFSPPRSNLDTVLYMTRAFKNISKYFRYLVNITLHKSMRKGDIPLAVYLELEKKIIERVKNVEHCGQATQLLLNYLTWYREKMMMFLDTESIKILIEVKYYSEKVLEVANSRLSYQRASRCYFGEAPQNTLLSHLNYCYYMAVFLGGDDRCKVCGPITDSLHWFSRLLQRAKDGNKEVNLFINEISRLANEMEEEKRGEPFGVAEKIRKRKPEPQNAIGWNPFSGQSFPLLKKTAVSMETDSPGKERPAAVSVYHRGRTTADALPYSQTCDETVMSNHNEQDSMDVDSSAVSVEPAVFCRGGNGSVSSAPECVPRMLNGLPQMAHKITSNTLNGERYQPGRVSPCFSVPVLTPQRSTTDYSIMPKQFFNICPFYKYIIASNLQKLAERYEVTHQTYRELMTRIVENITNLESCIEAVELITSHLKCKFVVHEQLFKALEDVRMYASALVSYMQSRGLSGPVNSDLDDYYVRLVPNQMSFLYHLVLLLGDEDKAKLSGRLGESVKWLQKLVQKNKAGDVEVLTFFERVISVGEERNASREVMKDLYEEFNTISNLTRGNNSHSYSTWE